jgi:hypothetical protein
LLYHWHWQCVPSTYHRDWQYAGVLVTVTVCTKYPVPVQQ